MMVRISLIVILTGVLVGCASAPLQTVEPSTMVSTNKTPESPATEPQPTGKATSPAQIQEYPVPPGTHPHDVAPAPDGSIWYTAQIAGALGRLNPATGETRHIPLGSGSSPHGVIIGPDEAPWVTDSGLNAIVRVDPQTEEVKVFPLPDESGYANLNTAAFDRD